MYEILSLMLIASFVLVCTSIVYKALQIEKRKHVYVATLILIFLSVSFFSFMPNGDSTMYERLNLWGMFGMGFFFILGAWFLIKNNIKWFLISGIWLMLFFVGTSINSFLEYGILYVTDYYMLVIELNFLIYIIIGLIHRMKITGKLGLGLFVFYTIHSLMQGIIYGESFGDGIILIIVFGLFGGGVGMLIKYFYKKRVLSIEKFQTVI